MAAATILAWIGGVPLGARAAPPLRDAPVIWYADDQQDIPPPAARDPNLLWDAPQSVVVRPLGRMTHPGRLVRGVGSLFGGDHVPPASDLNSLDEVPNSSWFTNRIGLFPMTPQEAAGGNARGRGPDTSGVWTVIRAKTEGVTPGFNVKDRNGDIFVIKFDPPGFVGMTTAAGAICAKIFHAAGYNVPDDQAVTFARADLVIGEGTQFVEPDGRRRPMTDADLDAILTRVDKPARDRWLAIASRYLAGRPLGPFDWKGRRHDDPNDQIDHEDRREIRGLYVFCSWLNHYDTKQQNTLDMYVEENGRHYVRHHLIDFASTLGGGATGPVPRLGYEYTVDPLAIAGRTLSLGLHESTWRKLRRPDGLPEVGYFESDLYDPVEFKPLQPNAAFANVTDRDGYWAAKIISAFTDEHLRAICESAGYPDPRAVSYVTHTLAQRRDKIARTYFKRVAPLDFFVLEGSFLRFADLAQERGIFPGTAPRYRVRVGVVTADRHTRGEGEWTALTSTALDLAQEPFASILATTPESAAPFVSVECQVNRGWGWSSSVTAYVGRVGRRIVAVER